MFFSLAKISCTDVRRKVEILLRSTGRSEADLDRLISRVDEDEDAEAGSVLSEQLRRHIRDTKVRPVVSHQSHEQVGRG